MNLSQQLEKLCGGTSPSLDECRNIFSEILNGSMDQAQISGFLVGLRLLGESSDALVAGAETMRHLAVKVNIPPHLRPLTDNCGTGGDGASTFNISTAAAIVAGSCGVHMAKHGNRSVSSKCGSADLLFAAGFPDQLSNSASISLLQKTGFTFFFAPGFHPALRPIMPVRKSLGIRTVFNLLGPLANPVKPEFQVLGVGALAYLEPMAEALSRLGVTRAMVVHSRDGLDEISPCSLTDCIMVEQGKLRAFTIDPRALGGTGSSEDLRGGEASENLNLLRALLDGAANTTLKAAVALNAGAALWVSAKAPTLEEGVELARVQLASMLAREYFRSWIETATELAATPQ